MTPTELVDDVKAVFEAPGAPKNLLTAYQILDRLPQRDTLIAEHGIQAHVNAANVVSRAAKMLADRKILQQFFIETENLAISVNGVDVVRSGEVLAVYRLARQS